MWGAEHRQFVHHHVDFIGKHGDDDGRTAFVRNFADVHRGVILEQLAGHLNDGARAGRAVSEFARLLFGQRDEFSDVVGRQRRAHAEQMGAVADHAQKREVAEHVVRQLGEHGRVHCEDTVGP